MRISRIATILAASIASACSFYVLTRSGLAGTLFGAAVAGLVYSATSQALTHGLELGNKLLRRSDKPAPEPSRTGSFTRSWLPAVLGCVALILSVLALVEAQDSEQTVVVNRYVVTNPIIREQVMVQEQPTEAHEVSRANSSVEDTPSTSATSTSTTTSAITTTSSTTTTSLPTTTLDEDSTSSP